MKSGGFMITEKWKCTISPEYIHYYC